MSLVDDWNRKNLLEEGHYNDKIHFAIQDYLSNRIRGKNLDLACGGFPHIPGSIGLDISNVALNYMRDTGKYKDVVQFNLADLGQIALPFKDNVFDSSTMISGWNYIPVNNLFEELSRIVKDRGRFFIVQFDVPIGHSRYMIKKDRIKDIVTCLEEIGYHPQVDRVCETKLFGMYPTYVGAISIQF